MKKLLLIIAIAVMFISCSEEATKPIITQEELDIKNYENQYLRTIATYNYMEWDVNLEEKLTNSTKKITEINETMFENLVKEYYDIYSESAKYDVYVIAYLYQFDYSDKVFYTKQIFEKVYNYNEKIEWDKQIIAFKTFKLNNKWYNLEIVISSKY